MKCCICRHPITGYGHNPWPIQGTALRPRCCDICNDMFVIPARFRLYGVGPLIAQTKVKEEKKA